MKLMKTFVAIILCFSLVGCGLIIKDPRDEDIRFHRNESFVRDKIIEALDSQDEALLKNLFSNETIALAVDIDNQVKEFIAFYKGNFISYDSKSGSESGLPTYHFNHWYVITTDEDEYVIYFDYTTRDNAFEEDNRRVVSDTIGLHAIVILRKELADEIRYNPWPHYEGAFTLHTMDDYLSDDY